MEYDSSKNPLLYNASGEVVAEGHMGYEDAATFMSIYVTFDAPITAEGVYTLKVPAGAMREYGYGIENPRNCPAMELTYNIMSVKAESIVLDKTKVEIVIGESDFLTATILPETASNKDIVWTSSDEEIAVVNEYGVVTAVALGEATITATTTDGSDLSASCKVTVVPTLAESITLNVAEASLKVNETTTLTATVLPETATNKSVTWTSSNESVATVDANGMVTALEVGVATITATTADGSDLSASCKVTVLATPGDVNNDGKINVTDVVATASYILGNNPARFVFEAADMNHSNSINVTDIIGIASIILNGGASHSPKAFSPATESSDYLHAENFGIGEHQSKSLSINLHNTRNYTAFQMDVHIPEGLRIEDCKLSDRGSDHTIDYQVMTEGVVRIIAYSISNSAFAGNDGCLVELTVSADDTFEGATISIDEIIFAEADMTEHHFDAISLDADYVGIDDVENNACKVFVDGQAIIIESTCVQ
jgi:hypothetical protein